MKYFLNNISNKLKRATVISRIHNVTDSKEEKFLFNKAFAKDNLVFFIMHKVLFKFLFFFSRKILLRKNNRRNLMIFIKLFNYLNFFFFNNKIHFFKKFFLKKEMDFVYHERFFLSVKYFDPKKTLVRLKQKKKSFYKKNIWFKKRRFRKKNILIFNKLFFRRFTFNRFNDFVVNTLLLSFLKRSKQKHFHFVKKYRLFGLFYKKYYYLFLHKRFVFNKKKKKRFKNPRILKLDNYRPQPLISYFYRKKKIIKWRWKRWRQVYTVKRPEILSTKLFCTFDTNAFNSFYMDYSKKNPLENTKNLRIYLKNYSLILAKKYIKDKGFLKRFFSKKTFRRRLQNVLYYYRSKPKILNFYSFNFLNRKKNLRNSIFSLIWYNLFLRKIFWKNKKLKKKFFVFFFRYFFNNKNFIFFNSFIKCNLFFNLRKRRKRLFRFKKRRLTFYNKKKRRRILKRKIKIKVLRFFIILLLFNFMRKNKSDEKSLILKYSLLYKNLKKINSFFLFSIFFSFQPFYFYNSSFSCLNTLSLKNKNLKFISLFVKNKF